MKTILYIQYFDPAAFPPLERSAQQFLDRGWCVHFLGIAPAGVYPEFAQMAHPNLSIVLRPHAAGSVRDIAAYHFDALRTIARLRPDVVYVSQEKVALIGLIATFLPRVRTVLHEHDTPFFAETNVRILAFIRRLFARRANLCVVPQADRAQTFRRETGAQRVMVVFNTPSLQEVARIPHRHVGKNGALALWHHGSLGPSRLPLVVIDALALLPDHVILRFAGYETWGTRGYVDELLAYAAQKGVRDRVAYIGSKRDRDELYAAAASADIGLALFTDRIGMPMAGASNKPFDFLACGMPVLTSNTPEWTDFFAGTGVAVPCDASSAEDVARALRWFLDHPEERDAMGARGRSLIETRWNYESGFAPVMAALDDAVRL